MDERELYLLLIFFPILSHYELLLDRTPATRSVYPGVYLAVPMVEFKSSRGRFCNNRIAVLI